MSVSTTRALLLAQCAGVCLWLAAAPAHSQDSDDTGFYIGLSLGETEFFNDTSLCKEFTEEVDEALNGELGQSFLVSQSFAELVYSTECRQRATDDATKYFVGYRFNRAVAVEVSRIDFGTAGIKLSADASAAGGSFAGDARVSVEVTGISVTGLFGVPLGERASAYARLGILNWEATGRGTATGTVDANGGRTTVTERFVESDDGADIHYGFGGRFRLTENVALRAEWERYEIADLNLLSAGVELSF